MRAAVALPEGEDKNEWLAVHTVDFYNEISILFGTIADKCDPEKFPEMTAGPKYKYLWADKVTAPVSVPGVLRCIPLSGPQHPLCGPAPSQTLPHLCPCMGLSPAREYVDLLLAWIEGQVNNEEIFPTSVGRCCPPPPSPCGSNQRHSLC
jgi:MOB kinase activator 1